MSGKPCNKIYIKDYVIGSLKEDIQCKVFHKNKEKKWHYFQFCDTSIKVSQLFQVLLSWTTKK